MGLEKNKQDLASVCGERSGGLQEIREWVGDVSIKGKGGKETHLDNVGSTKACYYVCSFGDKGTRNTCTGESFRCQGLFVLKAYMSNFKGFFCLK